MIAAQNFPAIERGDSRALSRSAPLSRYGRLRISCLGAQKGEMLKRQCFALHAARGFHIELRQFFADSRPWLRSGQRERIGPQFQLLMARQADDLAADR